MRTEQEIKERLTELEAEYERRHNIIHTIAKDSMNYMLMADCLAELRALKWVLEETQ